MMQRILELFSQNFTLTQKDVGEFAKMKASVMKFQISQYEVEGVGNLSVMQASGMFGLMKMDTVILTPFQKDMPLLSYDRVLAMGNDTAYLEMYDTLLSPVQAYPLINEVKGKYSYLPDHAVAPNWYDSIKRKESVYKKSKKQKDKMDALVLDYLSAYIKLLKVAPEAEIEAKKEKSSLYVNGLLTNGGPSTDVFMKSHGKEKTTQLFEEILFGTK